MRLTNKWIHGDCLQELKKMDDECIDLIITSPPYLNLRVYSNDPHDISNCETYEEYFYLLGLVVKECERVLKPGGKFVIQYENYHQTLGRDNCRGQISLVGGMDKLFTDCGMKLWTQAIWTRFTAQRAMIVDGALWMRNQKNKDTQLASNFSYVDVYRKNGETEPCKGVDITLKEWAEYASGGTWIFPNSANKCEHLTPFAEELVRRCIKLWSYPGDTVLDPFGGTATVNKVAIECQRNAIGIELNETYYKAGIEKRLSQLTDDMFELTDSKEKMTERFLEELKKGEEQKEQGQKDKEEKKSLTEQKKKLRAEIKDLESQLKALGLKAKEIKEIKESAKDIGDE